MSRETCIQHRPKQPMAIVREDYRDLTGDFVSAALLNEFEFRANAVLIQNPSLDDVPLGEISITDLQKNLLGLSTDKQIRKRLEFLKDEGFVSSKKNIGKPTTYVFHILTIQARLNDLGQMTRVATSVNQPTEPRSNDQGSSVNQPTEPRSNDRHSIYKNYSSEKKTFLQNAREQKQNPEERGEEISVQVEIISEQPAAEPQINSSALVTVQPSKDLEEKPVPAARSQNDLIHATRAGELDYYQFGWGTGFSDPDDDFLRYAWKIHIATTSADKGKPYNRTRAKSWLRKGKTDQDRLEHAMDLCADWKETKQKDQAFEQHSEEIFDMAAAASGIIPEGVELNDELKRLLKEYLNATGIVKIGYKGQINTEIKRLQNQELIRRSLNAG